jgi:hypothetical protein
MASRINEVTDDNAPRTFVFVKPHHGRQPYLRNRYSIDGQEISHYLWDSKIHFCVHPPLDPVPAEPSLYFHTKYLEAPF